MQLKCSVYNMLIDKTRNYLIVLSNGVLIIDITKKIVVKKFAFKNIANGFIDEKRNRIILVDTVRRIIILNYETLEVCSDNKLKYDEKICVEASSYNFMDGKLYFGELFSSNIYSVELNKLNLLLHKTNLVAQHCVLCDSINSLHTPIIVYNDDDGVARVCNLNLNNFTVAENMQFPKKFNTYFLYKNMFYYDNHIYDLNGAKVPFNHIQDYNNIKQIDFDDDYIYVIANDDIYIYDHFDKLIDKKHLKFASYVKIYKGLLIIASWNKLIIEELI